MSQVNYKEQHLQKKVADGIKPNNYLSQTKLNKVQ